MKRLRIWRGLSALLAVTLLAGSGLPAAAQPSDKEEEKLVQIGGRIHLDWLSDDEEDALSESLGSIDDNSEVRRARLSLEGTVQERFEYVVEYDFAGEGGAFKDLYFALLETPGLGAGLKIGHFKEPFSLEELISSNDITFLERSLPNAFAPSRNAGVMLHDYIGKERMTWALGVFQSNSDDFGNDEDHSEGGEYAVTGRMTAMPYYAEEGRCLLHLGAAASHRTPNEDEIGFSQNPEAHLAPDYVDTGTYDAEEVNLFGAEAAMVLGPLSFQSEWIQAQTHDLAGLGDPEYDGYYFYLSYVLTGEHRPYDTTTGVFDRIEPYRNFLEGGCGAWELTSRFSRLDLDDGLVRGGELEDFTLGVNWYWNPHTRLMFNYVRANLEREDLGLDEDADLFQVRFQFDF